MIIYLYNSKKNRTFAAKSCKTCMTNTDFWKNIDTIIAQGFDTKGLKQLEQYAELFISRRLVYQRFSPLEQHGCAAGGSNHVIASLLAGAGIDPSSLSAPEGSFQRERECAETQANRIEQWTKLDLYHTGDLSERLAR